jgi:hypothetical protein
MGSVGVDDVTSSMRACSAPFATASSPCATIRPVQPRTCRRCSLDGSRYVIVRRSCWSIHQGLPSDEPKSTTFDRSGGSPARRYFTLPKVVAPHSFMRLSLIAGGKRDSSRIPGQNTSRCGASELYGWCIPAGIAATPRLPEHPWLEPCRRQRGRQTRRRIDGDSR